MGHTQRILLLIILAGTISLGECADPQESTKPGPQGVGLGQPLSSRERIVQSLAAAERYLIGRQDADGAWRSDTYGVFKDGPSLTPLVLDTLPLTTSVIGRRRRPDSSEECKAACRKGAAYLAGLVKADGTIDGGPHGLSYPLYTSALAVRVLSRGRNESFRPARDAWLAFLRKRQLTEDLGWHSADKPYGGWGYCYDIPRKPKPGEPIVPLTESNLSATVLALKALEAAGCPYHDPAIQKALVFIERCQNFSNNVNQDDSRFDDGGFFFIYDDAVRNKAGAAGKDQAGRERFHSYGSTTADGLRGLLICGLSKKHPRVLAARRWLESDFDPTRHPGNYNQDREMNRSAVYFYYSWSFAGAYASMGLERIDSNHGPIRWAEGLAEELIKRQEKNGSWSNPAVAVREDDPLVATSLAARALGVCWAYVNKED